MATQGAGAPAGKLPDGLTAKLRADVRAGRVAQRERRERARLVAAAGGAAALEHATDLSPSRWLAQPGGEAAMAAAMAAATNARGATGRAASTASLAC